MLDSLAVDRCCASSFLSMLHNLEEGAEVGVEVMVMGGPKACLHFAGISTVGSDQA